ncbi:MAG: hypothetical protein H8Z69_01075 [Nanohaloarchaea archaeon]|nr:hypothetical protein [Candidatus Nanohaloarchaea archaeon]
MIAGIILSETDKEKVHIAFLGDEKTETLSLKDNEKIVEKLKKEEPDIVAVDADTEHGEDEFSEREEELKEEGYNFTPASAEKRKVKRLQGLKAILRRDMEMPPEFIRFDPFISARELALEDERGLESLGIETEGIKSDRQFDAMLGAVTARFYDQSQFRDLGVIVPGEHEEDEDTDERA